MPARVPLLPHVVTTLVLAVVAALLATVAPAAASGEEGGTEPAPEPPSDLVMVQANLRQGLSVERFQEDVAEVLALAPDFVTYNEASFRNDLVMAPEGYDIYRKMRNRYTAATPVAWRSDRWTAVDTGTRRVSNYREVPPGRNSKLGLRFANWVTLRSNEGRVLSVVSVHVAPYVKGMPDLRHRTVRRIGKLVSDLAPAGPVLVGGDFNLHYKSGLYPRGTFETHDMAPTYDTLGNYFPTGDHGGYTIDYLFRRGADLVPDHHYPVELNSDHDGVVSGMTWQSDLPSESEVVVSDPDGDRSAQRAAVREVWRSIRAAEPGAVIEVVTSRMGLRGALRRLTRALEEGVHVRLTTRSRNLTKRERRLANRIQDAGDRQSWVRECDRDCRRAYRAEGGPSSLLLVSDPAGHWRLRVDASRKLRRSMITRRTEVVTHTGDMAIEGGARMRQAVY